MQHIYRLTQAILRERVHYDPETGVFTSVSSGKVLGYRHDPKSGKFYWVIQVGPRTYRAHRLAWLYMTGGWPVGMLDHTDGDGLNNRWLNLRPATNSQNTQNSRARSDNISGLKGANFCSDRGNWKSSIWIDGGPKHLGMFATAEEAHAAYCAAAKKYFGEFARTA